MLFSAPVRRLADKTQVFPLEPNDSVRTRLTHSHEVSTLARAIGAGIVRRNPELFEHCSSSAQDTPVILATVGLAHDLGNPPFGHQGEKAIQEWVSARRSTDRKFKNKFKQLSAEERKDFLLFEGNAHAFRLLTRLQIKTDGFGLDLTCGTLAALLKYPVGSTKRCDKSVATKKHGFFAADRSAVEQVWEQTGLSERIRHPLAYVMEAADDIAYSVIDVEDAVKKGLVSFADVVEFLQSQSDDITNDVIKRAQHDHQKHKALRLSPDELDDISSQKLRVHAITALSRACIRSFLDHYDAILSEKGLPLGLIAASPAGPLCKALKRFALQHAYQHRSVLEIELRGRKILHDLMDIFWPAIDCEGEGDPAIRYVYSRISESYRRVFKESEGTMSDFHRKLLLLTDMIAGMTDGFAVAMHDDLRARL